MTRPLNFLHLTTFYPPYSFGGDAMYLYRLTHALGDAGHQVDVVHCKDAYHLLHPSEPTLKFAEHPNVRTHVLTSGMKWLSPLLTQQTGYPLLKTRAIRRVMQSKAYDVVHYHNISLLGPQVLRMSPPHRQFVKMYMTHEHWLVCPMHVLWKYGTRACDKPSCLRCTLKAGRPPQLWRHSNFLPDASRHVDQFVSPSKFTARMHEERGFAPKVDHLPYFIDRVDHEWRRPGARPQPKPYYLFVGRLEKIKGLQTLIALWDKVDEDLLVAGTGDYENELRAQAAGNPRIKFLGTMSQRELGALYHHAIACLVPSVTYETFGIIIIEALARKTPVIVRDLGALPEVVEESGGGLVYRTDEELLASIKQLAATPVLRRKLGESGYRAFVERWSKEAHLKLYFDYLRRTALRKFGMVPWEEESVEQLRPDLEEELVMR